MEIHSIVDKVAQTEARVLITGESGTGKISIIIFMKEVVEINLHSLK